MAEAEAAAANRVNVAGGGLQQPLVRRAPQNRSSMRDYAPRFINPNIANPTISAPAYGQTECRIFFGDQDATGESHNLAFQLNLESGQAEHAVSKEARAAFFLGCIINTFPGRRDEFIRLATDGGYRFEVIRVPSGMAAEGILMPAVRLHPSKQRAIFGYLVLMLFKQINENSYASFTARRIRALLAVAAYDVDDGEETPVFNDIYNARTYRTIFGQNFGLRSRITKCVIEKQTEMSVLGSVCAYVCAILSWADMTNLNFIMEALCVTESPVLLVPELATEVMNVERAVREVRKSSMPQYFRVLQPPHETNVLARNNFPRLAAIASKIKSKGETNAANFVTTMNADEQKILDYVKLHESSMVGANPRTAVHSYEYLINFENTNDED